MSGRTKGKGSAKTKVEKPTPPAVPPAIHVHPCLYIDEIFSSTTWTSTTLELIPPDLYPQLNDYYRACRVQERGAIKPSYEFKRSFGGATELSGPCSVAIHPFTEEYYVSSTQQNCIQVFDNQGKIVRTIGSRGCGKGQFIRPAALLFDVEGHLYVVDAGNKLVQKFDNKDNFLLQFGQEGDEQDRFDFPTGMTFDNDLNLVVCEYTRNFLWVYTPTGTLIKTLGKDAHLRTPTAVCVDFAGNYFVCSHRSGDVMKLGPTGECLGLFAKMDEQGSGVLLDKHENVIVSGGTKIVFYSKTGELLLTLQAATEVQNPWLPILDRQGNLLIASSGTHKIVIFG